MTGLMIGRCIRLQFQAEKYKPAREDSTPVVTYQLTAVSLAYTCLMLYYKFEITRLHLFSAKTDRTVSFLDWFRPKPKCQFQRQFRFDRK